MRTKSGLVLISPPRPPSAKSFRYSPRHASISVTARKPGAVDADSADGDDDGFGSDTLRLGDMYGLSAMSATHPVDPISDRCPSLVGARLDVDEEKMEFNLI